MARSDRARALGRMRWGLLLVALALCLASGGGYWWWQQQARLAEGEALFRGEAVLAGVLAGQSQALPSMATRCSNCHETRQPVPLADKASSPVSAGTYASPLSALWLQQARLRHGGPQTRYDARSLCQLLRTGVDPAMIMVSTVMPRYQATDAQCAAVWTYLTSR